MEKKKEINVKLADELFYDYQGDKKQAQFICLKKPTAKSIQNTSIIKNAFQSAAIEIAKKNEGSDRIENKKDSGDEVDLEPEEALQLLYSTPDGIEKCMLAFKELLREVATFDGEIKATLPLIDSLSVEDFENIFGKFLVNFILASLLEKTSKL
jgi:hypothetical protein